MLELLAAHLLAKEVIGEAVEMATEAESENDDE